MSDPLIRLAKSKTVYRAAGILVGLVAIAGVASWQAYGPQPKAGATVQSGMMTQATGAPAIGGPFKLMDDQGRPVTEKNLIGDQYHLIFFGFASCPDVCPGMLMMMAGIEEKLPVAVRDKLQFVFVSVDPKRDSLAKLGAYVRGFSPRFVGWTGDEAEIDKMVKNYLAYYALRPDPTAEGSYTVDHSSFAYLMGPDGKYVAHYRSTDAASQLQQALEAAVQ
jgi:protein SCO1/2